MRQFVAILMTANMKNLNKKYLRFIVVLIFYWNDTFICHPILTTPFRLSSEHLNLSQLKQIQCMLQVGNGNSNTVNSKFHLIRSYCEKIFYHFPNISCLKCTVNSNFHLIQSKTLLKKDFELTVPDLYYHVYQFQKF